LRAKYPETFHLIDPMWERITERWRSSGPGVEWYSQGATPPTFCNLCQLVLCGGTPRNNSARMVEHNGERYVFCSEPCAWIFGSEPDRYRAHKDLVKRILAGEAPANVLELLRTYFLLTPESWGKDAYGGRYGWLSRDARVGEGS
jgi:toluene monooxygenase system protein A